MNRQTYRLLMGSCMVICIGLFWLIVRAIDDGTIVQFDLPIIQFTQGLETDWLTVIFKAFTWLGSSFGVIPITIILCFLLFFKFKRQLDAFVLAFTMISTILLNEGLKKIFLRERPEIYRIMDAGGYSFPSGHTMMAVSLYVMIVLVFWRRIKSSGGRACLIIGAFLTAFFIAMSRIYLGVHFPSDIAGGVLMSTLWLAIVLAGYRLLRRRLT